MICDRFVVGGYRPVLLHRGIGEEVVDEMYTECWRANAQQQPERRRRPVRMESWPDGSGEDQGCEDFAAWEGELLGLGEGAKVKRRQQESRACTRRSESWQRMAASLEVRRNLRLSGGMLDL